MYHNSLWVVQLYNEGWLKADSPTKLYFERLEELSGTSIFIVKEQ